ncbi:hypothetical protein D3C80_1820670 [compost metagenome]
MLRPAAKVPEVGVWLETLPLGSVRNSIRSSSSSMLAHRAEASQRKSSLGRHSSLPFRPERCLVLLYQKRRCWVGTWMPLPLAEPESTGLPSASYSRTEGAATSTCGMS